MRFMTLVLAASAAMMFGAVEAQAVPATIVAPGADTVQLTPVADGCGPGGHRDFRGFCRPGGGGYGRPYGYGGYGGPRCFVRETIFGPRRVCR